MTKTSHYEDGFYGTLARLEKTAFKYRKEPILSDAEASRIDAEAFSSGKPALRAPSRSEWTGRIRSLWRRDTLSPKENPIPTSPITDAVVNTAGRIGRGQYAEAFNGVIDGLTEIGSGLKANGGQRGNGFYRNGRFVSMDGRAHGIPSSKLPVMDFQSDIVPEIRKAELAKLGPATRSAYAKREAGTLEKIPETPIWTDPFLFRYLGGYDPRADDIVLSPMLHIRPEIKNNVLSHEFRHVLQNKVRMPAKSRRLLQQEYGISDSRLGDAFYPWCRSIISRELQSTNAEYQYMLYNMLRKDLGRRPTYQEYVDYIDSRPDESMLSLRDRVVNSYDASARSLRQKEGVGIKFLKTMRHVLPFPLNRLVPNYWHMQDRTPERARRIRELMKSVTQNGTQDQPTERMV